MFLLCIVGVSFLKAQIGKPLCYKTNVFPWLLKKEERGKYPKYFLDPEKGVVSIGSSCLVPAKLYVLSDKEKLGRFLVSSNQLKSEKHFLIDRMGNVTLGEFSPSAIYVGDAFLNISKQNSTNAPYFNVGYGKNLKFQINEEGIVGIGTSPTNSVLQVNTGTYASSHNKITVYDNTRTYFQINKAGAVGFGTFPTAEFDINAGQTTSYIFKIRSGNQHYFALTQAGQLGINTSAPLADVDVVIHSNTGFVVRKTGVADYFTILGNGNVGIGVPNPAHKLEVCGIAKFGEAIIEKSVNWCDYVFENDFKRPDWKSIEKYYGKEKHLMKIPSEKELDKEGINIAEVQAGLLYNVELNRLDITDLYKELQELRNEVKELRKEVKRLREKQ